MANATKLPTLSEITFVQLSRPDAPNPRLSAAVSSTATTLKFENPLLGSDGNVITEALLLGVRNSDSYVETVYIPAAGLSADGLTATGCVRGINLDGLDWTTGDSDLATSHKAGDAVFCNISGVIGALYTVAINGTIATGGVGFTLGTEGGAGSETITLYRTTTAGNKLGFLRWNHSGTEVEYSDDGSNWVAINDVSASDLAKVSATDTTASYLNTKITVDADTMTKAITSPGGDERLELTAVGGLADIVDDVTATAAEINQALDGISGNVTDTNLNTCFAGSSSNMDAFHTHTALGKVSLTTGEAIDGSTTPQYLCQAGESNRGELTVHLDGVTSVWEIEADGVADLDFGDADARTQRAQSFTETDALAGTITVRKIRVFLQKTVAPVDNVYLEIQSNDTNKPDGTAITNGTSDVIAGAAIATTHQWTTFTFSTPPTITSGTKYWFVIRRSGANDAVNFYSVGYENADNYASHGNSYYTASTLTWSVEDTADFIFQIEYGKDYGNKVYKMDADNVDLGCNYVGTTEDDVAADAAISVLPPNQLQDGFTGLTASSPYYASDTAGSHGTSSVSGVDSVAMIVSKARSATEVFLKDDVKYFHKILDILDFGEGAASDGYLTIITGFRPVEIRLRYQSTETGVGNNDGFAHEQTFTETTNKGGIAGIALGANETVETDIGAVRSFVSSTATDCIIPYEIFDNGMTLRVKTDAAEQQFDTIHIEATGY